MWSLGLPPKKNCLMHQLGTVGHSLQPRDIATNLLCNSHVQSMQHSNNDPANTEPKTTEHKIWWEPLVQLLNKITNHVSSCPPRRRL